MLWTIALLDVSGCARSQPVQKSNAPPPVKTSASKPSQPQAQLKPLGPCSSPELHLLESSGVTVWAKGFRGLFIAGWTGHCMTLTVGPQFSVQQELRERGLYEGPINGILDRPTMKSIYEFQEANNLQRCGVPTPHTRKMLEQVSHTDISY